MSVLDRLFQRSHLSPNPDKGVPPIALAFEPQLIPPARLMRREGVQVLEDWFQWPGEWTLVLRLFGGLTWQSTVLEIGCGLGRVAYPLRVILTPHGSYDGFDIVREKIEFLQRNFATAYPNFHFAWADVQNTTYNPRGRFRGAEYRFPYTDQKFDLVYAASVYTHLLPETSARYLQESARVLKPGGRCVISVFLLDYYRKEQKRPWGFAQKYFAFDHAYGGYPVDRFAVADPADPENTTAYSLEFLEEMIAQAGLRLAHPPLPGVWSGTQEHWVGPQEFLILQHA